MSTNVSADKVLVYADAGEVLDTRQFHVHAAGGDPVAGHQRFTVYQGTWLVRRQAFEGLWRHGDRFVDGALNVGGLGVEGAFGKLCLVIDDPEDPAPDALAVFPGDSAKRYAAPESDTDAARAQAEAASWSCRAAVPVLEREAEALASPGSHVWPSVVCRPGRYLEVARAGALPLARVREVRLRHDDLEYLEELRARSLLGEPLSPQEAAEAGGYDVAKVASPARHRDHRDQLRGHGMSGPTLLAMAPSGEVAMVRDEVGRAWLVRSPAAGGTQVIDEDVAERAAAYHGFLWVDREFPSWPAMEEYRQRQAARVAPEVPVDREALDAEDIDEFLRVARRWAAEGDSERARRLGWELLALPAVRSDVDLHARVATFVRGLDEARLDERKGPTSDAKLAARQRWDQLVPA